MAILSKAVAVAAIFAALTSAAPLHEKRAVVYETVTDVAWTTVDTTITLFPGQPTPSAVAEAVTTAVAVPTSAAAAADPPAAAAPPPSSSSSTEAPQPTQAPAPPVAAAQAPAPSSSSSSTEAPQTTQAPAPAPAAPAPAPPASSTTSAAPPPASSSSSSSSSGGSGISGTGDGTYYDTATTMTNPSYCDTANDGTTENVVALSASIMNQGLCGKSITVNYGGKTASGVVVDSCPGCNSQSIDMSRALFGDLSSLDAGRITVSWHLN